MTKLYRFTTLEDSYACNFNVLIAGVPRVLGVKALLENGLLSELSASEEEHILTATKKLTSFIF